MLGLYRVLSLGTVGPEPWGLERACGQRGGWCLNRLCLISRLILGFCGREVVFQEGLQVLEGRSLLWVQTPGLQHGLVQGCWATWGARHVVAMLHLFQHFSAIHAWRVRLHQLWGLAPSRRNSFSMTTLPPPHPSTNLGKGLGPCSWVQWAGSQRTTHLTW